VKLTRAWHAFLDDDGAKTASGGRRLTLGIDQQGRLWLSGEAIGGQDVLIGPDTAAWLSGALTEAIRADADDAAEAAAWLAGRGRLEGQLKIGDFDPWPTDDAQGGMSQFGSLPVVDDDDDDPERFPS
jgi:hypothetical protein